MPYSSSGTWILVKKAGRWVRFQKASSPEAARKQAAALNIKYKKKGEA
jgi:hypothetical protein